MKNITLVFMISLTSSLVFSQQKKMVCHTPQAGSFAYFSADKEFLDKHPYPKKYTHQSEVGGKMITFDCPDGNTAKGYVMLSKRKTQKWIFVFQEWWGLNDNIKKWAEDLYNEVGNVNVMALDMYDGKLATDRETAAQYMQAFKRQRGDMIVKGALAYVGEKAKIGTIGWCFGGGESLQAALTVAKQAVGCVMYYGMPEDDVSRLKTLHTDVLNIWGTQDKWINKEVIEKFKKNMAQAKKQLTVQAYDADHAFANPSNPIFDKEASEDAKRKVVAYFRAKMQPF